MNRYGWMGSRAKIHAECIRGHHALCPRLGNRDSGAALGRQLQGGHLLVEVHAKERSIGWGPQRFSVRYRLFQSSLHTSWAMGWSRMTHEGNQTARPEVAPRLAISMRVYVPLCRNTHQRMRPKRVHKLLEPTSAFHFCVDSGDADSSVGQ